MNYSELIDYLLKKRGHITPELQQKFLYPDYEKHTYSPFLLPDIKIAIGRILQAIQKNEKICIYSDYDADGIPGAVVLHDFFKEINYTNVTFYIPHRHSEGYGLHIDALEKIANDGVTLLVTVDLGITAHNEVEYAKQLGVEIIITDHHEPLATLPNAYAIVNPKIPVRGVFYPDTMLCGCATAFKFVQGILAILRKEVFLEDILNKDDIDFIIEKISIPKPGWEKWLLDMVGVATLSDMVPLVNENRVFAVYGLRVLQKSRRPGLLALLQMMKIRQNFLTAEDVVFSITPRLNAASRMAHPEIAFQLLTTSDFIQATEIAQQLSQLNDERKLEVARAMKTVHKKLSVRLSLPNILVVGDPDWSPGVLGLIASKIVEEYDRTVFVWCIENEIVKGSCRARNGDHVVDLMNEISDQFIQYGGHEGAGGFSTQKDNIHFLEEKLNKASEKVFIHHNNTELVRELINHDISLSINDISMDLQKTISILSPFGLGNQSPIFLLSNITPISITLFGKGKEHLEIVFSKNNTTIRAIQFFTKPERYKLDIENPPTINLYGQIEYSVFMGRGELRLKILDIEKVL